MPPCFYDHFILPQTKAQSRLFLCHLVFMSQSKKHQAWSRVFSVLRVKDIRNALPDSIRAMAGTREFLRSICREDKSRNQRV